MELKMDELRTASAGQKALTDGETAKAVTAIVSGAVSGSGIGSGTPRPGGAIAAAIGGAMGAAASFVNWMFGE